MEESKKRLFNKHLPKFVEDLDPIKILPYLAHFPRSCKEEVETAQRSYYRSFAVSKLHENLIRRPEWWIEFQAALRHPEINLSHLANLLDSPTGLTSSSERHSPRTLARREIRRNAGMLSVRVQKETKPIPVPRKVTGEMPIRKLDFRFTRILERLDCVATSNWKDLAGCLGYSMEDVQLIEAKRGESAALKLIEKWSTTPEATLGKLMQVLKYDMERLDVVTELENFTGFKLPEEEETAVLYNRVNSLSQSDTDVTKRPSRNKQEDKNTNGNVDIIKVTNSDIDDSIKDNNRDNSTQDNFPVCDVPLFSSKLHEVGKQMICDQTEFQEHSSESVKFSDKTDEILDTQEHINKTNKSKNIALDIPNSNLFYCNTSSQDISMVDIKLMKVKTESENSSTDRTRRFTTSEDQNEKVVSVLDQESTQPGPYIPATRNALASKIIAIHERREINEQDNRAVTTRLPVTESTKSCGNTANCISLPFSSSEKFVHFPGPNLLHVTEVEVNPDTHSDEQQSDETTYHDLDQLALFSTSCITVETGAIPKKLKCLLPTSDILEIPEMSMDSITGNYSTNSSRDPTPFRWGGEQNLNGQLEGGHNCLVDIQKKQKSPLPIPEILEAQKSGTETSGCSLNSAESSMDEGKVNEELQPDGNYNYIVNSVQKKKKSPLPIPEILEAQKSSSCSLNSAESSMVEGNVNRELQPDGNYNYIVNSVQRKKKSPLPISEILESQMSGTESIGCSLKSADFSMDDHDWKVNEKLQQDGDEHLFGTVLKTQNCPRTSDIFVRKIDSGPHDYSVDSGNFHLTLHDTPYEDRSNSEQPARGMYATYAGPCSNLYRKDSLLNSSNQNIRMRITGCCNSENNETEHEQFGKAEFEMVEPHEETTKKDGAIIDIVRVNKDNSYTGLKPAYTKASAAIKNDGFGPQTVDQTPYGDEEETFNQNEDITSNTRNMQDTDSLLSRCAMSTENDIGLLAKQDGDKYVKNTNTGISLENLKQMVMCRIVQILYFFVAGIAFVYTCCL